MRYAVIPILLGLVALSHSRLRTHAAVYPLLL